MRNLILSFPLFVAAPALAADQATIPYETYTLDNGLQVILSEDHRLPLVAVDTWYHVGALNEVPGRSGFAHLFEHIMFQGSRNVAEDTYFRYLEGAGASDINGTTDFDRTNYFETLPANQLELALWLESDRMGYLLDTLGQERLDNQKAVVRKERQQSENTPYYPAEERMYQLLFPAPHPYNGVVIGSHSDLEAATLDDVRGFFDTYYSPNNATLVIVGDFDPAAAKALVEKYYGDIAAAPEPPPLTTKTEPIAAERREVVKDEVELPRVFMGWVTSPIFAEGDADLQLAGRILGGGKTSRLYERLVYEKQIATDVAAYQYPLTLGSVFVVDVTGRPGVPLQELEATAWEVVGELAATPPSQEELDRVRRSEVAEVLRGLESLGGFGGKADVLNYYNHHTGDPGYLTKDLARFAAVTPESLRTALATQIRAENRVVVHVEPVAPAVAEEQP